MHCNRIPSVSHHTFSFPQNRVSSPFQISFPTRTRITVKTQASRSHPGKTEMSLYELLDIPKTGSLPEIKHAYKQLARRYHPDVSPAERVKEYTDRFIRVNEAYQTLSDPTTRALYDLHLSSSTHHYYYNNNNNNNNNNQAPPQEEQSVWTTTSMWQREEVSQLMNKRSARPTTSGGGGGARMRRQRK